MTNHKGNELLGKFYGWYVGKAACTKRQFIELLLDRGDNRGVAEAHLVHAVTLKIQNSVALQILQKGPSQLWITFRQGVDRD